MLYKRFWFQFKISSNHFEIIYAVIDITRFGKYLESSLRHTLNFCPNFCAMSFREYVSKEITHPVFYGDLEANFISSDSKIVKRLRRRQYDPAITERTIGLVLGPLTALSDQSLSVAIWLTRRLELYDRPCLNLLRGDRVLIPVAPDC